MSYMIRKAEKEDLPRIYEIYETARQFMRENGNHAQWGCLLYTSPSPRDS